MLLECLCEAVVWFVKYTHIINIEKSLYAAWSHGSSYLMASFPVIQRKLASCEFTERVLRLLIKAVSSLCVCVSVCVCVMLTCCNCVRELNHLWISSCIITHLGPYLWPFLVDALNIMARHWSYEQVLIHDSMTGPYFCLFCRKGQGKCSQGQQPMAKWHLWRRFLSTTSANRAAVDIFACWKTCRKDQCCVVPGLHYMPVQKKNLNVWYHHFVHFCIVC